MKTAGQRPARPARVRRRTRLAARAAVAACAVLVALVAAELLLPVPAGLAAAIWRQARGSLEEYEPGKLRTVAGFVGEQTVGGGRQRIRHDRLGMRGSDPGEKQPGERRVLFLGDSVTYGTGVQEEQTFARRLEPLLAAALGAKVATGIAASPGFGVRDQAPFLRRVEDGFAPDLVVSCVFVENDLYDDLQLERGVFAGYPVFQASHVRLLRRSWRARLAVRSTLAAALEQFLAEHAPALALDLGDASLTPKEAALWEGVAADQSLLFLEQVAATPAIERLVQRSAEGLAAVQAEAAPVPTVVVLIPSYVQYVPGLFAVLAAARPSEGEHRCGTIQERLLGRAAAIGLPCFDLLPRLRDRADVAELLIPGDFHFTPKGHELVAECLAGWLAAHLTR
jgi:lysophospholipase L1-like esterase